MRIIKDIFIRLYWGPFKHVVWLLPARLLYFMARRLGDLLYFAAGNKRRSLEKAFSLIPDGKSDGQARRRAVRDAFRILMCNELEVLLFPQLNSGNIERHVACSGLENLDEALRREKGAMLLFAHLGANQMIMPAIGYHGYKMSQMSAPATVWKEKMPDRKFSPAEEMAMRERWRHEESLPVQHINIFGSLKKAFLCLKHNEVLGIAIDGGGGGERIPVSFLGREAVFSTGAADIACRTGCAVLPTFMIREKDGRSRLVIESVFYVDTEAEQTAEIHGVTQRFAKRLEEYIIQHPDHYINFLALREMMAQQGDTPLFRERGDQQE